MALQVVELHTFESSATAAVSATAEVCGKRDLPVMARTAAVRKFKGAGWHHDPRTTSASARAEKESESSGSGRWYCPTCAKKTHL